MHITTLMPTLSKILIRHLIQPHFASVHEHTLLEALQNRKKKRRGGQELEFFEGRNFKVMCACWQQLTSSIIFVLLLLLLWKFATITI